MNQLFKPTAAPPTSKSTRAATVNQPTPTNHQMKPKATSTGESTKSAIPEFYLTTSRVLFTRIYILTCHAFKMPDNRLYGLYGPIDQRQQLG